MPFRSFALLFALVACGTSGNGGSAGPGNPCPDDSCGTPPGTGGQPAPSTGGQGNDDATGGGAPLPSGGSGGGGGTLHPGDWNAHVMDGAPDRLDAEYAAWRAGHFHECPDGSASVRMGQDRVVSEGIGYGMLITATLGPQEDFDALHKFYEQAAKGSSGLMNWECGACGSCGGGGPATDADLDVAMALVQADARWGGYADAALAVIRNLRKPSVTEQCGSWLVMRPGDHWGGCSDNGLINPSYWAPGYYRVFAERDPEGADLWNTLIDDSYALLEESRGHHPDGLFLWPDAMTWNGAGFDPATGFSYNGYDACRVPWRLATDYAWTGDPRAKALLEWTSAQVDSRGFAGISGDANSAFYGSLALGSVAVSQAKANEHFSAWMSADIDDAPYYQGTLRVLYLLIAAGKFPSTL